MGTKNWENKVIEYFQQVNKVFLVGFVMVAVVILFAITQKISNSSENQIDWLLQSNWSSFLGAEKIDNNVKITPIGRAINHTDTSMAQPHPPVNANGSYLKVSGDFRIDMKVSGIKNEAILQFYGQVPVVYDEWRQERGSVRINMKNSEILIRVWDGTASNSIDQRTFYEEIEDTAEVSMIRKAGHLVFEVDGKKLGDMPDHNIFSEGKIWFGADSAVDSKGWTLKSLIATAENNGSVEAVSPNNFIVSATSNSLRNIAETSPRDLKIGVAVSYLPLLTDDKYRQIALSEFNMMTIENSFKPQYIQPQKGLFTFSETDRMIEIAEANRISVHGHSLVMGKATPEWMQKSRTKERKKIMTDHISKIVSRYSGKVSQWDVVNEPMSEDFIDYKNGGKGLRKHIWIDAMGEEYLDIAYKTARKSDPKAKLFLNDFGLENDGERWDAFLALVKRLQSRGVPIDGVGFEAHVYHTPADDINIQTLKKHIRILADLGLESRISEIDVLGDDPKYQSNQYGEVLKLCISEPSCTSYGTWGITDLYGSTNLSDRYPIVYGDSLLWDLDYNPKPAYQNLQKILKSAR